MRNVFLLIFLCLMSVGWSSNGGWDVGTLFSRSVIASSERATTSDTITAGESGKTISVDCSTGTGQCTLTLPTAQAGMSFTFISEVAEVFYVDVATTADTIRYLTMAAGNKVTSPGVTADSIELFSTQANYWNVKTMKGIWTNGS